MHINFDLHRLKLLLGVYLKVNSFVALLTEICTKYIYLSYVMLPIEHFIYNYKFKFASLI